ncbi:LysR family transcriptional regulator [Lactobacillus sp. ESL0731]|uniref:LysR family transcriptional regulator n=1 Tax=unclassified Lactobacillus TaxID=2620435 RepID=UPI0023F81A5D|nr:MULTISPECIES: LysR family transcriptional regulator [unclassified Lactobacillus]WEV50800.1 LysR family transcriptional regulator [Lactobacillus sp. ESL0700]WEV61931.1 LysR family transcriptional regulator [Lactobacillus sp. ESL0731]
MDIKRLVTFINLVETRNYTRTARAMHVTQPTVTHDINAIEDELGVKLFNRNKRYVNVTKNGWVFYQKIKPLINSYYSVVQDMQKNNLQENYQIALGYSYSLFNDLHIPIWIKQFQELHPQVEFLIENLSRNELKQHLLANDLDVMITTGKEAEDLQGINSYLLETEHFKAIVSRTNPLSKCSSLKLDDFNGEKMLFLDNNWAAVDLINLQNEVIHNNKQIDVTYADNLSSLNILLRSGQGITLGLYCIYADLPSSLTYVPLKWDATVDLLLLKLTNNRKRIVHSFIKFVQKLESQNLQNNL